MADESASAPNPNPEANGHSLTGGKAFPRNPNRGGRPSKFDQKTADAICLLVKAGNFIETAAAYHGIHKVSLYSWFKKGNEHPKSKEGKFLNALLSAVAESELRGNGEVLAAGAKDWRATAWRLSKRFPQRWGGPLTPPEMNEPEKASESQPVAGKEIPITESVWLKAERARIRREVEAEHAAKMNGHHNGNGHAVIDVTNDSPGS